MLSYPRLKRILTYLQCLRTDDKNWRCKKDEKVGTDTRCRDPLFALPTTGTWRRRQRDGRARSRARKCALASLCIFQKTRVYRRAAIKWHETDRYPWRAAGSSSRVISRAPLSFLYFPSRKCQQPRFIWPCGLCRRFYTSPALLLSQFSVAEPKVANAGITRR